MTELTFRDLAPGDPVWDEGAFEVLRELRDHLDQATFDEVHRLGAAQGLVFTGAYRDGRCVGVAGWRVAHTTHVLRKLYVDDLVTASSARSTGVGAALLAHLADRGRQAGCHVLDLDSGHQRTDAHRFYLREGMADVSRHFAMSLHDPA